jgi:hypothetical protein
MKTILEGLRQFFARDADPVPVPLHVNNASQHELYYAELMERGWAPKPRDYPFPPGWTG